MLAMRGAAGTLRSTTSCISLTIGGTCSGLPTTCILTSGRASKSSTGNTLSTAESACSTLAPSIRTKRCAVELAG